jgi:hypothetical protein
MMTICHEGSLQKRRIKITQFDPIVGREPETDPVVILNPHAGQSFELHEGKKYIVEEIDGPHNQ